MLDAVKIAKPILLVSTPVGVLGGLFEAYRLAGGLVILAAGMVGLLGVAAATVVHTIRTEAAAGRAGSHNGSGPRPAARNAEVP
jgi:hypothetical protein